MDWYSKLAEWCRSNVCLYPNKNNLDDTNKIMAFVNLITEEIYGCKEGGLVWFHEKGHIEFNKTELGNKVDFWKGNIFQIIIGFIVVAVYTDRDFFKQVSLALLIVYLFLYLFEEVWCWFYAFKNKK